MLAATADILAAVASSRALARSPDRLRSDHIMKHAVDGARNLMEIPAQKHMGRAVAPPGPEDGGAGVSHGLDSGHEPYVLQPRSLPRSLSKSTFAPDRVARLDSSMQVFI